jgi:multidrug efflux system membrane fusion protein
MLRQTLALTGFVIATLLLGAAGEPPRPVRVQTVVLAPARSGLAVSGTVQARIQADLAFRVGGKVIARPVEIGDHIRTGQVLARLDPADLQFSEEAAAAALVSAQADAAQAQADLRRYDGLGGSSPAYLPSEYDKRLAAQRMAAARLVQAQRQLALARDQSAYGVLTADADGIVTALPVQIGQVVSAGQTTASVAHTAEIEIVADVPENRLAEVRAATDVGISLRALPGTTLHGRVREIGALADAASRTFAVKVSVLDAPPGLLALGMTAAVSIGTEGPPMAVLPAAALTDQSGKPAVWVLDPTTHHASLRPVDVSSYGSDANVLVSFGLAAGEQVITAGVQQLEPGMALVAWAGAAR